MRIVGNIIGLLLLGAGILWIGQGMDIIGGSVMSGDNKWTVIGGIVLVVGLAVLWWANLRSGRR